MFTKKSSNINCQFTQYQRMMWTALSYLTVCRYYIIKDKHGQYAIHKCGKIRIAMYYLYWTNSVVKISYLVLTYHGWLVEVHFLDQMSMWDWFLCFSQLVQETNIWYRKYPLYEVIHSNWTIMEEAWNKMDTKRKEQINDRIMKTCKSLVYMHSVIVFGGCGALMIQFFTTPKYALNTYAALPFDNWILRILFAAHEYVYMMHIWVHQACSIVLVEVFAVNYTHILSGMGDILRQLIAEGQKTRFKTLQSSSSSVSSREGKFERTLFIPERCLEPKQIAQGTQYNINDLLYEYKKVMIATKEFNAWAGKLMGGTTMSNYGQFVSDVFMMIQLLKEPDTDFMGVFFYFVDACAGMAMLFRMLILLSRVYPQSQKFMRELKNYVMHDTPLRKQLIKEQRTLRIVAAKLGGYSTNPTTVPKGVNALMNYYIGAAMWKRPEDRRT